jgi:hypothetical protein
LNSAARLAMVAASWTTATWGRELAGQVKKHASGLDLPQEEHAQLDREIATVEVELANPKPNKSRMRNAFDAVKRIGEGVAAT